MARLAPSEGARTHHADRPDGHDAVTPVAVGPGVPAWVLPLLQDEHLAAQVLLLISHPSGGKCVIFVSETPALTERKSDPVCVWGRGEE